MRSLGLKYIIQHITELIYYKFSYVTGFIYRDWMLCLKIVGKKFNLFWPVVTGLDLGLLTVAFRLSCLDII